MIDKKGYINVSGSPIYYELSGNPNGEPLVLLHGGLGSIGDLTPLYKYIAPDYSLISMDFRGHGKSPLNGASLSYEQYQSDVQEVLSHLGIKRYSLFGFSDGGIVGYRLAAQQPESIICLITLGSQWRLETNDPSIELLRGLTAEFWAERFPAEVDFYNASNPKPDLKKLVDAVKPVWLDTTESGYPCDLVESIACPSLIIRGDNDFLFSLNEAAFLKTKISGADFANIPFTEHASHQESPELVGTIVKQFLSQQKA
ncbi:alpha/beta fold hydrolase [Microbulbifer sp. 2304DJ12-6]|uniref:alpha/beta fold hydrolase n=1 Tax=Microbulbifer sp. 2304DJ12-6 TaxID=3233340 RepID=UPI0039AF68F7